MSDESTNTQWRLDLDVGEALEGVTKFQEALKSAGETESLSGLIETMTHMGVTIGAVGAAIFAMKESVDLVFDAEKIKLVEQQFEVLSEKAGVVGSSLKRSMIEASEGLLAEDQILQSANRGLVELGANAAQMGDIMKIARQATLVMGGDLKTNFDSMIHAISAGSTRALRNLGIIIDQKKAFKDYARSIGIATSELSKAGQQHALLNAVMQQGGDQLKGVSGGVQEATNSWATFQSTMKDVGDIAILAFDKIAGPAVKAEMGGLSAIAKDAKKYFLDIFGHGTEQAAVHTERLHEKINEIKGTLIDLEQKKLGHVFDPSPGDTNSRYQALSIQLKKLEGELGESAKNERKLASETAEVEKETDKGTTKDKEINLEQRKKNQLKFEQQLTDMRIRTLEGEKKDATTIVQIQHINFELIKQIQLAGLAEQKKIDEQEGLSFKQKEDLKVQLAQQTRLKIKAISEAERADEVAALQHLADVNRNTGEGFAAGWKLAGTKAKEEMNNFAKHGEDAFGAVASAAGEAFKAMGNGSKSAGDAMIGALLGALGQFAISKGSVVTAAGIADTVMLDPIGPAEIVAGGALVTLGSALEALSGSIGSSIPSVPSSAPSSGGSSGGSSSSGGAVSAGSPSNLQQAPQKSVSLEIHGNYYDSNESKMQLMTMIRQATDATDFNYTRVGGK